LVEGLADMSYFCTCHACRDQAQKSVFNLSDSLAAFVTYVHTHLKGDEKGEAADVLDHLFRPIAHERIKEVGASR